MGSLFQSQNHHQADESFEYTVTRHGYKPQPKDKNNPKGEESPSSSFSLEQSLDVYIPKVPKDDSDNNSNNARPRPIIILVMGSGWLGHAPWIYHVTNWWNAGGPKQICHKLGYTCISVRHSGGFFHLMPTFTTLSSVTVIVVLGILQAMWWGQQEEYNMAMAAQDVILSILVAIVSIYIVLALLLWIHGPGAGLDDMVQDVNDALIYIQSHGKELGLSLSSEGSDDGGKNDDNDIKNPKWILGGYSSGAHVAATWLAGRQKQNKKDDNNDVSIDGVLFISGVLSLDSWLMNVVTWAVFGKPAKDVSSPLTTLPPRCTTTKHLLVGCRNETFGVPVLDASFCSAEYVKRVDAPARYVSVPYANHWTILDSGRFVAVLREHLPWLLGTKNDNDDNTTMTPKEEEEATNRSKDMRQESSVSSISQ